MIDAYLAGLESLGGTLSRCHSVASFAISPVDAEVDRRLVAVGTRSALRLRGKIALAQAKIAYRVFEERFFGAGWQALVRRGAKVQRPLWPWTTVADPALPDLWYAENLVGPNTVTSLRKDDRGPGGSGRLARTIDHGVDEAEAILDRLGQVGVDLSEAARAVECNALSAWSNSYDRLMSTLTERLGKRQPGTG